MPNNANGRGFYRTEILPSAADWPSAGQAKARDGSCKSAPRAALGCARVGSFAVAPHSFVFAFVRDPLDRFVGTALAALQKPLNNCSNNWFHGRVCPHTLAMLRSLAASLLRSWPHRPSSLPLPDHWLTQSYFLAATNAAARKRSFWLYVRWLQLALRTRRCRQ